jgi:hypothetical protein
MVTKTGRRPIIAVITMALIALAMFITTNGCNKKSHDKAAAIVGSSGSGTTADTTRPTVMSTIPANLAVDVLLNRKLTAVFSEAMDPATISTTTFTLTRGITNITGTVTYVALGYTATFSPTNAFTVSTSYTANLTIGVKDLAGNALAVAKTWSFQTGATADTTPPTVTYTSPANLAIDVPINARIEATFTEAMDPTTISTTTFTVIGPGAVPVTGTVALATLTATFLPVTNLASSTIYTATITTGVKDLAGNALAVAKIWSFNTGTAIGTNLAPVFLGTAGNFVILVKTGTSTTGVTYVIGDIGVSPAAASYITGFGLSADPSNTFSTSSLVNGRLYAANYAPPTPAYMTTAISDMETAYTDAAGRTLPDATELYAGDISGRTLAPGLYKWGTGVLINGGVTLAGTGSGNDVWIFQIAQDLTVGNAAFINLINGAQAKNIFWQVAGQVTLGTTANFKGIILCQTLVEMQTNGTFTGRALAQTAVTLDAATIIKPVE